MKVKQFSGCGNHGKCDTDQRRNKWDPWCLRCNPLPSPLNFFRKTDGQKEAARLDRQRRGAA